MTTKKKRVARKAQAGKNTSGLKPFKKGQSGNPKGRPPLPEDVKAARKLGKAEFVRLVNDYLWINWDEAQKRLSSKKEPVSLMEQAVGNLALDAANGDRGALDLILDRLIGKTRDKMELTMPRPFIIAKTDGTPVFELGAEQGEE